MSWLKGLGYDVNLNTAMKFTAVFAAMRLRAETIASLPKHVVERTTSGRIDAKDHPTYKLLKFRPNNFMNIFSFWEYINACLDGWGNAYVIIFRKRGGVPGELIPVHPSLVTISFLNRKKWYRVVGSKYFDGTYSDDDMLHFFSLSMDGIKGVNPISYNSAAIKSGLSSTSFGNEFFENGGSIKGVFETEQALDIKVYKDLVERLSDLPNYATPILERGLKYKEVGIEPEAAQMLETRTFALQDIARIFNIPPHMIADLSRATFSNIEHQDIQFVKYSIRPTVKRFETELDRKLFFDDEQGRMETKFNLDGMLRGDMKTRAEYYQKAVLSGWMSRNEVRELENMNLAKGLDVFLYPVNQAASTEIKKIDNNE
jgi:HK97 family phage portal protein